jgi:hypothetical protein
VYVNSAGTLLTVLLRGLEARLLDGFERFFVEACACTHDNSMISTTTPCSTCSSALIKTTNSGLAFKLRRKKFAISVAAHSRLGNPVARRVLASAQPFPGR